MRYPGRHDSEGDGEGENAGRRLTEAGLREDCGAVLALGPHATPAANGRGSRAAVARDARPRAQPDSFTTNGSS